MEENSTAKFLKNLGQLIAVIMIARYAIIIVNNYVPFLQDGTFKDVLNYIGLYAPMALMITVGLSAVWDKSSLVKLVFLIVCAAIVIFSFDFGLKEPIEGFLGF